MENAKPQWAMSGAVESLEKVDAMLTDSSHVRSLVAAEFTKRGINSAAWWNEVFFLDCVSANLAKMGATGALAELHEFRAAENRVPWVRKMQEETAALLRRRHGFISL